MCSGAVARVRGEWCRDGQDDWWWPDACAGARARHVPAYAGTHRLAAATSLRFRLRPGRQRRTGGPLQGGGTRLAPQHPRPGTRHRRARLPTGRGRTPSSTRALPPPRRAHLPSRQAPAGGGRDRLVAAPAATAVAGAAPPSRGLDDVAGATQPAPTGGRPYQRLALLATIREIRGPDLRFWCRQAVFALRRGSAQIRWRRTRPVAPRTWMTKRPRAPVSTVRQPVLVRRSPSSAKLLSMAPSTATSKPVARGT